MTHCERVLEYMRRNGSISTREANEQLACTRLSGRIYDLKKRGMKFDKITETSTNRFGEPCSYARYFLREG